MQPIQNCLVADHHCHIMILEIDGHTPRNIYIFIEITDTFYVCIFKYHLNFFGKIVLNLYYLNEKLVGNKVKQFFFFICEKIIEPSFDATVITVYISKNSTFIPLKSIHRKINKNQIVFTISNAWRFFRVECTSTWRIHSNSICCEKRTSCDNSIYICMHIHSKKILWRKKTHKTENGYVYESVFVLLNILIWYVKKRILHICFFKMFYNDTVYWFTH